jgi:small subunit ribosomal protein S8
MVNDHLSDFVTRIRNGYLAGAKIVEAPNTRAVEAVAKVLAEEGYVEKVEKKDNIISTYLKYSGKEPVIMGIRRVSRPGARIYSGSRKLPRVWGGLGINILSTPKGVISEKKARKLHAGGEIICQVW